METALNQAKEQLGRAERDENDFKSSIETILKYTDHIVHRKLHDGHAQSGVKAVPSSGLSSFGFSVSH